MIDIGKDLQSAFDYGYRAGVKNTLDDIYKTLERSLREQFAHLIETEPNNSVIPNNCETCANGEGDIETCGYCRHGDLYEPQTEPQTNADQHIQDVESVEPTQTEAWQEPFETDCSWK